MGIAAGILSTIALYPLWQIIQSKTGFVMLGHEAPMIWVFVVMMIICTGLFVTLFAYICRNCKTS